MPNVLINGIVAARDKQPYLVMDVDGHSVQMTMADARNIARDIERMCARTEADAMIIRFFDKQDFPKGAVLALLVEFREFRSALDAEEVEKSEDRPPHG